VAAAGAAEENRRLVADELAAAAGKNRRTADQARQVLLVVARRGASASAAVWPDAAADMGAADAIGLALPLRLQNLGRRRKVGIVSKKSITRQLPRRVRRAKNEPSAPAVLFWSQISCVEGQRRIRMRELGVQIGNSGLIEFPR
jgi:hypothetical protein